MDNQYAVKVISHSHVPRFGAGGQQYNILRVGILVGALGPYYHDFEPGQDSTEMQQAWITQQVNQVKLLTQGAM